MPDHYRKIAEYMAMSRFVLSTPDEIEAVLRQNHPSQESLLVMYAKVTERAKRLAAVLDADCTGTNMDDPAGLFAP